MSIMKPPFHTELNLGHRMSQGIVGCWLFNEAPPPLGSAMDLSGNGNHGTLKDNTHSVPGLYGPALSFDGNVGGDHVDLGSKSVWELQDFTVLAMISVRNQSRLFAVGLSQFDLNVNFTVNNLEFFANDLTPNRLTGSIQVNNLGWKHVCVTRNGTTVTLYVDGVFDISDTMTGTISYALNQAFIGRDSNVYFDGQISDVTIYNRALSAGEIKERYRDPFQMFKRNL